MRSRTVLRAMFVFYCAEAGAFLLMAPWSALWDRTVFTLPLPLLHAIYLHPIFRGAISGLGAAHLVWGAHDIDNWLLQREARR